MASQDENSHKFIVTDVQLAEGNADGVALVLTDARGGTVTLNLNNDMAELLRQKVAIALTNEMGP